MGWRIAAALTLLSCGDGAGSLVELSGAIPSEADSITVTVVQTHVLQSVSFDLTGKSLPQTVGLNAGSTRGAVIVVAQATSVDRVVATGWNHIELGALGSVKLLPACIGAGCGCTTTNCLDANARCGAVEDACGGVLDCGACPEAQVCTASDAGQSCGSGTCAAGGCPDGGCGLFRDGCGGVLDCGQCNSG